MESDLFKGAMVRLSSMKSLDFDPRVSITHKPPKGKVFVAILIGIEDKDPGKIEDVISGEETKKILQSLLDDESRDFIPGCTISSATGFI